LDSGMLKPMEEIKYLSQLQSGLDKYGLSLFGRKEKPELEAGENPLDDLRKLTPENSDHSTSSPN
jgi:hypothetical protein